MSAKIGCTTNYDSVVAASFQNTFPGAYARATSSTSNTSDAYVATKSEIPVLPLLSKWDVRDGRSGRRLWVLGHTRKTQ